MPRPSVSGSRSDTRVGVVFETGGRWRADQTKVRLWETSGRTGVVLLEMPGYRTARETDLLEREREALAVKQGKVSLNARGYGFSAVKLIR